MTILYDEKIIKEFADSLYASAFRATIIFTFVGSIATGIGAGYISQQLIPAGIAFGAIIGFIYGKSKGFKYKLEAQLALCNAETERHARQTANVITELLMIKKGEIKINTKP